MDSHAPQLQDWDRLTWLTVGSRLSGRQLSRLQRSGAVFSVKSAACDPNKTLSRIGRVEVWRGGLGGAYLLAGPFVCRCLTSATVFRFHTPLIEPDVRFSRIRLSDQVLPEGVHAAANIWVELTRPKVSYM